MTGAPQDLDSHLDSDLALALELADLADALTRDRFRASDLTVSLKPDRTHVTDADKAAEQAIRAHLEMSRPDDSIFGEEFGTVGNSARQWIIDPIDGTANFLRGVPVWSTLIALAVDGQPVLGVVSMPALGRRWWAATGRGAFTRDIDGRERGIRVSDVGELEHASVALSGIDRFEQAGRLDQYLDLTRRVWRTRDYSDALPYMFVAEGVVDVAGEFDLQPYDMAALFPIITEAGGRVTSFEGESGPWHGSALASNAKLHSSILDLFSTEERS